MQRKRMTAAHTLVTVSILTGPEGPMQPLLALSPLPCHLTFQSSPAPKGRCNLRVFRREQPRLRVSILTGPEGPMQLQAIWDGSPDDVFQSSPAPKGRCNLARVSRWTTSTGFNPHRPRRADATFRHTTQWFAHPVSILTGPEGPMQLQRPDRTAWPMVVSILTGPEGPMQRRCNCHSAASPCTPSVSILTGPEGPMQLSPP